MRPKRRKSKDNPYTLSIEDNNTYKVSFKGSYNKINTVEINEEIFKAFDSFELADLSQMNEDDLHRDARVINNTEESDNIIFNSMVEHNTSLENIVENNILNEEIKNAINKLSEVQKRRIILYYFLNYTQREIADIEGTSIRAVQYTLNSALNKLRELLKHLEK